jgi:SRSO17 transposase
LLPGERKSVEPIAAVTAPARVAAQHQSLLHFVAQGNWSDEAVLAKVRAMVLPKIERHGAIEAWVIDDTGFPKHGKHSVGVSHQYCGQTGKQDNCQVAVSLSLANHHASLPVAYRLYLPKGWAEDATRRAKAGVPENIAFQTKPKIALDQLAWACAAGLPRGVVLMDSAYGTDASLRRGARDLGLDYAAAVHARTLVETCKNDAVRMTAEALALALPKRAWQAITWREGAAEPLCSRFARLRVQARGDGCTPDDPEEWLLIEWPKGEEKPTKFWLSTLDRSIAFDRLVDITMMRWRIERDYLDLKQEVGLGHFEGRGWVGFHHHATMCIAAYGFLISERGAFPPSQAQPARHVPATFVPTGYRPRGSPAPA